MMNRVLPRKMNENYNSVIMLKIVDAHENQMRILIFEKLRFPCRKSFKVAPKIRFIDG